MITNAKISIVDDDQLGREEGAHGGVYHERSRVIPEFGIPSAEVLWSNQKLDEIDAVLTSLESSIERLTGNTRERAERAVRRLRKARDLELEIQACCFDTTAQVAAVIEGDPPPDKSESHVAS